MQFHVITQQNIWKNRINSCLAGGDDIEVIIVDDGSTKDNTLEIAKKYEEQYPGIVKAVHQENGGHGQAVNTGLANATGVFFKVVDSDDWVDIKSYRKILTKLKEFVEKDDLPDMVIANYVYEKVGAKEKKLFIMRMHSQLIRCLDGMIWGILKLTSTYLCIQLYIGHSLLKIVD